MRDTIPQWSQSQTAVPDTARGIRGNATVQRHNAKQKSEFARSTHQGLVDGLDALIVTQWIICSSIDARGHLAEIVSDQHVSGINRN